MEPKTNLLKNLKSLEVYLRQVSKTSEAEQYISQDHFAVLSQDSKTLINIDLLYIPRTFGPFFRDALGFSLDIFPPIAKDFSTLACIRTVLGPELEIEEFPNGSFQKCFDMRKFCNRVFPLEDEEKKFLLFSSSISECGSLGLRAFRKRLKGLIYRLDN